MTKRKKKCKFQLNKKILIIVIPIIIAILIVGIYALQAQYTTKSISLNKSDEIRNSPNPNYIVNLENDSIVYTNNLDIDLSINNFEEEASYRAIIKVNDKTMLEKEIQNQNNFSIDLENEGSKNINIIVYKDTEESYNNTFKIYYIKPYEEQFLDELATKGVNVHYIDGTWENYNKSLELYKNAGVKYIRDCIKWESVEKNENQYDFSAHDKWINQANEYGINVILHFGGMTNMVGNDKRINSEEELNKFLNLATETVKRYENIKEFELFNEPNLDYNNWNYANDNYFPWYARAFSGYTEIMNTYRSDAQISIGSTANIQTGLNNNYNNISSTDFFNKMLDYGLYKDIDAFAFHLYNSRTDNQDRFNENLATIENSINDSGGFIYLDITEYGNSAYDGITEEIQGQKLVKDSITLDENNIRIQTMYNGWNKGSDTNNKENNYGLLYNNYTPKPAYYTMKNYYENTNGAEYIGKIDSLEGITNENLEAHVYNKDGKTKIIVWANNSDDSIEIPYEDFNASDIYGNSIENTDGKLEITTSPIYLDNISNKYFFEGISNTALDKYTEFEEKFSTEIASIEKFDEEIQKLKDYMNTIANSETETQENAIEKMSEHFTLGNTILNAYRNGKLNVEYVKISSMLDMLNDIGDSYQDLVTVSAKSREPYFASTEDLIKKAEDNIKSNQDLDVTYPSKILEFSKDLLEKAEYINDLDEENDIKTGLMVSNSLHAYYLADWANEFTKIYVNDYIEANPITVSYSNTDEFTNQNVEVTLNIGADSKVTNNDGKNTFTFTNNGRFTFEFERRGQACTYEVVISNIDKQSPEIIGVINGKIYINAIKPIIQDENLQSIEVLLNDEKIEYVDGMDFQEEGKYNITATDKAGNTANIEFYIIQRITDEYVIKDDYILNVMQQTTNSDFASKFGITKYSITRDNTNVEENSILATGDVLELDSGEKYTIIVAGDINGDGRVANYDLSALRRYILRLREFNELESLAADINIDGQKLGVKDYSRMKIEILGKY